MRERKRENERTQCVLPPPPPPPLLFHRSILLRSLYFVPSLSLLLPLSRALSLYAYVPMFIIRCRRVVEREKDELLAHIQATKRSLCIDVSVKKAITARSERRAIFSRVFFPPVELFILGCTLVHCLLVLPLICARE